MRLPGRRVLRTIRYMPERTFHPIRRSAARRRVSKRRPEKLLVLCLGNICRSPFAEAALRRELRRRGLEAVEVRSAGFVLPGRMSPTEARDAARARDLDLGAHRSAVVTPDLAGWADLVLVMSRAQRRRVHALYGRGVPVELLGDFDPGPIERRAIIDPVERPREVFERVYDRIASCCASLADCLADPRGSARAASPPATSPPAAAR
ncbi:MAG: hypothetical protein ACRELC_09000, partial [Gemmatimonadota bacterium]